MVPFDFHLRTRIVFGQGGLDRLGQLARGLGFKRTLLVSDQGIVQAGYVGEATQRLEAAGVDVLPFQDFVHNPDSVTVEAGRKFAESWRADSVIGLGGGSSLDCAKAINFVLSNGGAIEDYRGYGKATRPLFPAIALPTTAGSGSGAQSYAYVSDAYTHSSMEFGDPSAAARIALLDPEVTFTAPHHVTAMAGFDAIAHAVETAVTMRRTVMSDTFSHKAWRLLSDGFERVLLHPADSQARAGMQLGAHYAGLAIEQSMLGAAHACASPLTARYAVQHGLALAILLPHVVRWNGGVVADRYAALLNSPRRRARDEDAAETLAARLEDLAAAAGLGLKLSDSGIDRTALPALAGEAAQHWTAAFNPRPLDVEGALEIYSAAL
ncbi:MAG: alcohol dehydrogenase [Acidobacteriota bacterium]